MNYCGRIMIELRKRYIPFGIFSVSQEMSEYWVAECEFYYRTHPISSSVATSGDTQNSNDIVCTALAFQYKQ